ncbi:MAG: GxxExxY protein [Ferruginibacter sp.]
MAELLFKNESYTIVGICMTIHKALGMGLKEINFKDAMEIDFIENRISYCREKKFSIRYKDQVLQNPYKTDFIVFNSIVLEIKSSSSIVDNHLAQALSYLSVTGLKLALVINFGERSLTWKRVIL